MLKIRVMANVSVLFRVCFRVQVKFCVLLIVVLFLGLGQVEA